MLEILKLFYTNPLKGIQSPITYIVILCIIFIIIGSLVIKSHKNAKWYITVDYYKNHKTKFILIFLIYLITGILQQTLLVLIYKGINYISPDNSWNMIFACGIFAMLHFPNFILMFAVLGMGLIFLHHFDLYENIYLIGIYHGLLGNTLKFMLPEKVNSSFTVWFKYIRLYKKNYKYKLVLNKLKNILQKHINSSTPKNIYIKSNIELIYNNDGESIEPDLIITRNDIPSQYDCRNSDNDLLIMEIIREDSNLKNIYSKYKIFENLRIQEYWIIDIVRRKIEIYKLHNNKYDLYSMVKDSKHIESSILGKLDIKANDLFTEFKFFKFNPFI